MNKVLNVLGIVMLAFLIFIGLVHAFLRVQGKNSPETMASLHAMPVVGGFFPAPPPEKPAVSAEELRELKAKQDLLESREFFALPEGFDRKTLDELVTSVRDTRTTYEQGLLALEKEKDDLARVRAEVQTEKQVLEETLRELETRARDLEAGREELDLHANRLRAEESKNLKACAAMFEEMAADAAANIVNTLERDTAARILKLMSPRKSGRILAAVKPADAVELAKRMQAIVTEPAKASAGPQPASASPGTASPASTGG